MIISKNRSNVELFEKRENYLFFIFTAVIIWIAHFSYSRNFGIYEDDISFIVNPMRWDFKEFINNMGGYLRYWPQGRPLHFFLANGISYIGYKIGGLPFLYFISFTILFGNSILLYKILNFYNYRILSMIGVIFFVLYPTDTTQQFLTHSFGIQTAVMFFLLGAIYYLQNKYWISYLLLILSLLTNEPLYLLSFAFPLLNPKFDFSMKRKLLFSHLIISSVIFLIFSFIRLILGEIRLHKFISDSTFSNIILNTISNMVIGPISIVKSYLQIPQVLMKNFNIEIFYTILFSFIIFFLLFRLINYDTEINKIKFTHIKYYLFLGFVFIVLGYSGSFAYYPVKEIVGRATRSHIPASIGVALFFGSLILWFSKTILKKWGNTIFIRVFTAILFSVLVGYRVWIQQDYVQAHRTQQWFWSNVIKLIPDAHDGTVVVFNSENFPQTSAIFANSWADIFYLENIFNFSEKWNTPPRLISLIIDDFMHFDKSIPYVKIGNYNFDFPFVAQNIILLEYENGKIVRKDGNMIVSDYLFKLKPYENSDSMLNYEKGPLYEILIVDDNSMSLEELLKK